MVGSGDGNGGYNVMKSLDLSESVCLEFECRYIYVNVLCCVFDIFPACL